MINILKTIFTTKAVKKNPIAANIVIKETSANTWWS